MPPVVFEPTISAGERAQTYAALQLHNVIKTLVLYHVSNKDTMTVLHWNLTFLPLQTARHLWIITTIYV